MHDFSRLQVWRLARELGTDVYKETAKISRPELRLITSQLRRSALSIAANIAEGCGKGSRAETICFLEIAAGSAAETEHHLLVARDIGILTTHQAERFLATIGSVRRMLRALIQRLPPDPAKQRAPHDWIDTHLLPRTATSPGVPRTPYQIPCTRYRSGSMPEATLTCSPPSSPRTSASPLPAQA